MADGNTATGGGDGGGGETPTTPPAETPPPPTAAVPEPAAQDPLVVGESGLDGGGGLVGGAEAVSAVSAEFPPAAAGVGLGEGGTAATTTPVAVSSSSTPDTQPPGTPRSASRRAPPSVHAVHFPAAFGQQARIVEPDRMVVRVGVWGGVSGRVARTGNE